MARQLVDYSSTTAEFSQDRDIGVALKSSDLFGLGMLRYQLAVMSGKGRNSFAATDTGLLYLARIDVLPLAFQHGHLRVFGYRFGNLAYITDVKSIPPAERERLRGLDVLVLNALWWRPHPTHLSIPEAVETAQALGARRTYLTHLTHETGHAELAKHHDIQVAQRLVIHTIECNVLTVLEPAAREQHRQVVVRVRVGAAHAGAIEDHRPIEQRFAYVER
jgi:hypothetical protein